MAMFEKCLSLFISFWLLGKLGLPATELYLAIHFGWSFGMVLFHLQHSVNLPYRERKQKWDFNKAALEGSTFMRVPWLLRIFTLGIEYHHIHHLNTNVASYVIQ